MIILRTNHPRALQHACDWIATASKSETDAIGFLPHAARERHHNQGLIFTAEENGDLLAFAIRSPLQKTGCVQIHQSFTVDPARRLLHQTELIATIAELAKLEGAEALVLKCGDDLDANKFWRALSFEHVDQTKGGSRRGRLINHFRLPLTRNSLLAINPEKSIAQDRC